jgi:SAM-dependent methyltransferase
MRDADVVRGGRVVPSLSSVARLPFVRRLRCAQFRRMRPLGNGRQRGVPIVRHYWDRFLEENRADVRGRALEVGTTETIRRVGGPALTHADAVDLARHSPEITVVADLTRADEIASATYDCFVNQFTMHLVYDLDSALYHSLRILRPGGTLLVNFPSVEYCFEKGLDMGTGSPMFVFWQFTPLQVENLFRRAGLSEDAFEVKLYGNLFTRVAYQMNVPAEELTREELEHVDPGHPLLICVRAVRPADWKASKPEHREPWLPRTTPARWNPVSGHYAA